MGLSCLRGEKDRENRAGLLRPGTTGETPVGTAAGDGGATITTAMF